jgi:hypothetical protein
MLRQCLHKHEDDIQFILDMRFAGFDQAFDLKSAMAVDDEAPIV